MYIPALFLVLIFNCILLVLGWMLCKRIWIACDVIIARFGEPQQKSIHKPSGKIKVRSVAETNRAIRELESQVQDHKVY